LQVLHGGTHVFFHQLCHLMLCHCEALVCRRRRFGVSWVGPTVAVGLDAVTYTLQGQKNTWQYC
jgi:hypothetical protein